MRRLGWALALALTTLGAAPAARRVEIKVSGDGYVPSTVKAKPGEKLVLVFTLEKGKSGGCCDRIVVPAVKFTGTVEAGKPLEVPVTMPDKGKLEFACSMHMCQGEVAP